MSQSRGVTAGTVLVITSTSLLPYSVSLSTALAGRLQVLHMETSREDQRNVEATHVEHRDIPADLAGLEAKGQRLVCAPKAIRARGIVHLQIEGGGTGPAPRCCCMGLCVSSALEAAHNPPEVLCGLHTVSYIVGAMLSLRSRE